jgi:hypothetical protein
LVIDPAIRFDRTELRKIVQQVLTNRGTAFDASPIAFLESFYDNAIKKDKWNAFLKDISHEPMPLERVMLDLKSFLRILIF